MRVPDPVEAFKNRAAVGLQVVERDARGQWQGESCAEFLFGKVGDEVVHLPIFQANRF